MRRTVCRTIGRGRKHLYGETAYHTEKNKGITGGMAVETMRGNLTEGHWAGMSSALRSHKE